MQLRQYDLIFKRLTEEDLEILRGWRNSENIKQWMIFRKTITPESQLQWFNNLDQSKNYYFIVIHNQQRIGLMNIKNIDLADMSGEPGGFIVEEPYLGTPVPALCLLMLFDFAFNHLNLLKLRGKILDSNSASLHSNLSLGGISVTIEDGVHKVMHTKENYLLASARYRNAARLIYNESELQMHITI